MQMKQKISAVFMVLCAPYLLLTACDTKEQKEQNAKWEEQASFNAQAYIKQKYGFAASVTSAAGLDQLAAALECVCGNAA